MAEKIPFLYAPLYFADYDFSGDPNGLASDNG